MDKVLVPLIKTLNGQLKELPSVAQQMINQYILSNYIMAGIQFVLVIICFVLAFITARWLIKSDIWKHGDPTGWMALIVFFVIVGIILTIAAFGHLNNAMNPIVGLIHALS